MVKLAEGSCRSCSARILWAKTAKGGKMPLDAEPAVRPEAAAPENLAGLFLVVGEVAHAATKDNRPSSAGLYRSHFVSCPQRDAWRKKK